MSIRSCYRLSWLAVVLLGGCIEKATFVQGQDLANLIFRPTSPNEGIYPDLSVLVDAANPFREINFYSVDPVNNPNALQFKITAASAYTAQFYIWATILALASPDGNGEAQFYAAQGLQNVFYSEKAAPEDLPMVHDMAVAGFTKVLTDFAGRAVTYNANGTVAFELMTPSLQAILELGGTAPTGWILVRDSNGVLRAVKQ